MVARRQSAKAKRAHAHAEQTATLADRVEFPPPRRRMDWDEALRLYRDERWSFSNIARAFDYSYMTVRETLHGMGARRRPAASWTRSEKGRRLYSCWIEMRQRCHNRAHASYRLYGGRGVTICDEWSDFGAFARWARENGFQRGHSLHLLGGQEVFAPATCRLVTQQERHQWQLSQSPPHHTQFLTAFDETKSFTAWAKDPRCQVTRSMILHRLQRGLTPEQAISEPHGSALVWARAKPRTKRRRPIKARATRDVLTQLHSVEGLSCAQIARRLGLKYISVYEALHRYGLFRSTTRAANKDPEARRLYRTWLTIHLGCSKPGFHMWPYLGAEGIRVDERWSSFDPFFEWARATGARPGLCLIRTDRAKNYSPENCAWVTRREVVARARHHRGEKRQRVMITTFGETKGLSSWSRDKRCNVPLSTLARRLRAGMEPSLAITLPPQTAGRGNARPLAAFGVEKSLSAWIRDRRCKLLSVDSLIHRLERGMSPEDAIRTPPYTGEALPR
jgi:hypothetical protein